MRCLVAVKNFLFSTIPHTLTAFHTCSIVDVPESSLDNSLIYQQSPLSCKSDSLQISPMEVTCFEIT